MQRGQRSITIPNPHGSDSGPNLLAKALRQASLTREEWEHLGTPCAKPAAHGGSVIKETDFVIAAKSEGSKMGGSSLFPVGEYAQAG